MNIAEKIALAMDGYHTAPGTYGHSILAGRAWSKGGKTRVYVDKRHVGTDGRIDNRVTGIGYVELLASGDVVYALKQETNEVTSIVERVLAAETAP